MDLPFWIERINLFFIEKTDLLTTGLKALAALAGAWVAWLLIRRSLVHLESRMRERNPDGEGEYGFQVIRQAVLYLLVYTTGTFLIQLLHLEFLENVFFAALIVLMASPIKAFALALIRYFQHHVATKTQTHLDNILFDLLDKFSGAVIYATAVILALDIMGINVMPFVAGAGVAGIAIGFAAKDTLSNLIAGVLLIIDRPFEIGDRIEVWSAPAGSATWGDVIDIGLRATKIKTTDNIVIIIPNNEIMKRDIVNYTIITSKIRIRVNIGVAYDANIEKVKKAILEVADDVPWVSKSPAPKVVVRNFGESSVDLQLRVWIDDARRRMDTVSTITDRVKTAFDRKGIEIPFPKRDVHIIGPTPANHRE